MSTARKLTNGQENPIDDLILHGCEFVSDAFYKTGHTPNILTTYSLIAGLICIYFLINKSYWFFPFFALQYIFDCFDGYFARKYDMCTVFGDYYDHIKDVTIVFILIGVIYLKWSHNISFIHVIILICFLVLMNVYLGCQESITTHTESKSLHILKKICPNPNETIRFAKYFGCATFHLVFMILVYVIVYK